MLVANCLFLISLYVLKSEYLQVDCYNCDCSIRVFEHAVVIGVFMQVTVNWLHKMQ